jgi:isopenicillin-N N-acyltransferase like protein
MSLFPYIEIQGPPYERGREYGARAAAAIGQNIEAYLHLLRFHAGLEREAALRRALAFGPSVEADAPDLYGEMRGIAAGAGCTLAEVLLLNARSELMSAVDECTTLAAAPEVTAGREVLLAQNWDWYTAVEADPVLLSIRAPGQPQIVTLVEAGQVGKMGLNSAGLGLCLNFLQHAHRGQGLPIHVVLRQVLACASLSEAVQVTYSLPRAGAANLLLAHAQGDLLDLELTAADADYFYAEDGWLVHTNHFESPRLRPGDRGLPASKGTLVRAARARRLLAAARGSICLDTLRTILSDHAHGFGAICRHADPGEPPLKQSVTRASLIMDLAATTLHLAHGQPCRQAYQPIALAP